MNSTQTDTCHCLVRHPDKAKFMVIKHAENWSPPVLSFPSGPIDFKVRQINQGMRDKYGLKTRVLRPIMRLPNLHCVEMELISTQPSKKLQAVWVDEAEYLRTRSDTGGAPPDPFSRWFQEQASGSVPDKRPAFHRPGWFDQAEHWIQYQLDRLGIQATGSVEQYRQGWTSSCLLRAPTNQGWIYFKAGHPPTQGEAALTEALAERWPASIARPLAVDSKRNWMLGREFGPRETEFPIQQLPEFAAELAQLQLQSRDDLDRWKRLGCREVSLDSLAQVCQQPDGLRAVMREGGGGLSDEEWTQFQQALQPAMAACQALAGIKLPTTLVQAGFQPGNLAVADGKRLLLDWSGAMVSHPFLALAWVFQQHRPESEQEPDRDSELGDSNGKARMDDALYQQVIDAWLEPFSALASYEDLLQGIESARHVAHFFTILRMVFQLEEIEANTPHYYRQVVSLQVRARRFTKRYSAGGVLTD